MVNLIWGKIKDLMIKVVCGGCVQVVFNDQGRSDISNLHNTWLFSVNVCHMSYFDLIKE